MQTMYMCTLAAAAAAGAVICHCTMTATEGRGHLEQPDFAGLCVCDCDVERMPSNPDCVSLRYACAALCVCLVLTLSAVRCPLPAVTVQETYVFAAASCCVEDEPARSEDGTNLLGLKMVDYWGWGFVATSCVAGWHAMFPITALRLDDDLFTRLGGCRLFTKLPRDYMSTSKGKSEQQKKS